jgi:Ca2+-transporting ATPase
MVEEKSIPILESLGGTNGLVRGLGTSAQHGLSTKSLARSDTAKSATSVPAKNLPIITLTEPSGLVREPSSHDHPAYTASLEDRRRIYGQNVLPVRPSKSLLSLMWLALKDKVLVRLLVKPVATCIVTLFLDSAFGCCCRLPRAWSLPRFRHSPPTRAATSGVG